MGLKYYLRGLGVGIVVTTLIMGILTGREKETLSDAQIRERARELGMVEQSQVLADTFGEKEEEPGQEAGGFLAEASPTPNVPAETSEPSAVPQIPEAEENASATPEGAAEVKASPTPAATAEAAAAPTVVPVTPSPVPEQEVSEAVAAPEAQAGSDASAATQEAVTAEGAGTVTIEVVKGDGSFSVSKKLEAAGVVSSASELDTYLCQNGFDKRIRTGTFEIPENADLDRIARILVRAD